MFYSRQHPAFEMYICGVLFICLFIVFACELVWNVLINQKGFLYISFQQIDNEKIFLMPGVWEFCFHMIYFISNEGPKLI